MYPVWPVINAEQIIAALRLDWKKAELCALVFVVCADTGAQLRYNSYAQELSAACTPRGTDSMALKDRFAVEAERYGSEYDYRESITNEAILIPPFLHFYYGAKGKNRITTLLLREAVTLCRSMKLDKEETYRDLNSEDEGCRRRTFWLLYVTERGHAMQGGTHICLAETIILPSDDDKNNPLVLQHSMPLSIFLHPLMMSSSIMRQVSKIMVGDIARRCSRGCKISCTTTTNGISSGPKLNEATLRLPSSGCVSLYGSSR